jgi:dipeptidyl aminopeptidase/acylaminoacyl peptidase
MFLIMDNDVTPSPLSALLAAYGADDFLLVEGVIIIVLSSIFILSSSLSDQSAFATFPGENGKIAYTSEGEYRSRQIYTINPDGSERINISNNPDFYDLQADWPPDGSKIAFLSLRAGDNGEIYVMNSDGSEQTRLTNHHYPDYDPSWSPDGTKIALNGYRPFASGIYIMNPDESEQTYLRTPYIDFYPDWGPAADTEPPAEEDTIPPVIPVPDDITVEATSPDGAQVSFEVTAEDEVDGPTDVDCDDNSGETFPIGETVVTCSAEDLVDNRADEKSFTITVQDTRDPDVEITEVSDRRNGKGEIAKGSTTNMRYIEITFQATDVVGVYNTECSLDRQAFTTCTGPVVYDRLSSGTHQVTVRSTDAAGNTGQDQFPWTVNNPSAVVGSPGRQ